MSGSPGPPFWTRTVPWFRNRIGRAGAVSWDEPKVSRMGKRASRVAFLCYIICGTPNSVRMVVLGSRYGRSLEEREVGVLGCFNSHGNLPRGDTNARRGEGW